MEATAAVYARPQASMGIYGMGLTQHRAGVETVQMLVNLLLLRGNIGRQELASARCAATATSKASALSVLRKSRRWCRWTGLPSSIISAAARSRDTIPSRLARRSLRTRSRRFVMLGGNFVRAIPDRDRMEPAWRRCGLP